jgi:hypothetical protein
MGDTWDARVWVASVLGCDPSALMIRSRDDDYRTGTQVWYEKDGVQVARLIVAGPLRLLDGKPEGHWVIAVELADGTSQDGPEVPESHTIDF